MNFNFSLKILLKRVYLQFLVFIRTSFNSVFHVIKIFTFPFSRILSRELVTNLPPDFLQISLLLPGKRIKLGKLHVLLGGHLELLVVELQGWVLAVLVPEVLGSGAGGVLYAAVTGGSRAFTESLW